MKTYSNGFRQPCLKKNEESEAKQWFPRAFLITTVQFRPYNTILKWNTKMNEKSEEKLWFPTAIGSK